VAQSTIFVRAKHDGARRHLLVTEIHINPEFQVNLGEGKESVVLTRSIRALLEYKCHGVTQFAKSDPCWKPFWNSFSKIRNSTFTKDSQLIEICDALGKLFSSRGGFVWIDAAALPREAIRVEVLDIATAGIYTDVEALRKISTITGSDSEFDVEYALQLGAQLQIPSVTNQDKIAIGKAIWLSRLIQLLNLVRNETLACVGRAKVALSNENSFLQSEDYMAWSRQVDTLRRLLDGDDFREPAEKIQFDTGTLQKPLKRLVTSACGVGSTLSEAQLLDLVRETEADLKRSAQKLDDKITDCRQCFQDYWRKRYKSAETR
jgi:hypothetical protein